MQFSSGFVLLAASLLATATPTSRDETITFPLKNDLPEQLETCTEYTWSWTPTEGPYRYTIYQDTGGIFFQDQVDEPSVSWTVVARGGKGASITVFDNTGENWGGSGNIPVVNGTDTSCTQCAHYWGYEYC
ncbi:hypothetical protein CYLTODRAFT_457681 [Cylindrobasidium torrendii FP15055 ss-10]|uniref:Uncharacterized protein n=1 Tax=Cylindrobasidium torrendii FP15055 ss-10 TaxID=1314674 RepID=A0A0D7B178_9AGAR|nr:hypothetical protein CYLTODRAFT_457681 [Cylindrobasidium torrendii FP15055 ss-10]